MTEAPSAGPPSAEAPSTEALFFDMFGTLVDWRGSIAAVGTTKKSIEEIALA